MRVNRSSHEPVNVGQSRSWYLLFEDDRDKELIAAFLNCHSEFVDNWHDTSSVNAPELIVDGNVMDFLFPYMELL